MTEYVYLYEPRGYSPGYVYRSFDDALKRLLKDERVHSLEELLEDLEEWNMWHEIDVEDKVFSIDDGARITEIELL